MRIDCPMQRCEARAGCMAHAEDIMLRVAPTTNPSSSQIHGMGGGASARADRDGDCRASRRVYPKRHELQARFPKRRPGRPRGAALVSVRRDSPGLSRSIIDERALAGMADARANPEGPICCINAWWCNP